METTIKTGSPLANLSKSESKPLLAGIVTGQIAGLIMAVVVMLVFTVFLGKNPLYPVQVIGSTLLGEGAMQGFNFGAVLVGLVLHQAGPSLLWGILFGLYAAKRPIENASGALKIGLGLGVIAMVGPYILIPFVMKTLQGVDFWSREVPIFWDWAAHLVFGASFVLFPKVQKLLSK